MSASLLNKSDTVGIDTSRYVVITPVRNEAAYIEKTLESMACQTVIPVTWVIVNDGSSDGTETIVERWAETYSWIRLMNRNDRGTRQRGKGVIEAFYAGYKTIEEDYDFLVKLDGDVSFEPAYFESVLDNFASDPYLGIAGGAVYEQPDGKTWTRYTNRDEVRGCTKIYRRTCFEAIGGLRPAMGWDGIDEWTALSLGWKVRSFTEHKMFHYRFTGTATGLVKSYIEQGSAAYCIGYHPIFLIARGIRCITDKPYFIGGMVMIWAYFRAWMRRDEKLAGPSVIRFVRATQMKKLAGLLIGKPVHET